MELKTKYEAYVLRITSASTMRHPKIIYGTAIEGGVWHDFLTLVN